MTRLRARARSYVLDALLTHLNVYVLIQLSENDGKLVCFPVVFFSRGPLPCGRGSVARRRRVAPGGAERDRTVDLRLAKPALSQLSYSPSWARADLNCRPHAYQACALTT